VRKVAAGRIDLAEIDVNVLAWLIERNPDLKDAVRMNGHLLEDKPLHVCFQKTEAGDTARAIFNEGLKKIDIPSLMSSH